MSCSTSPQFLHYCCLAPSWYSLLHFPAPPGTPCSVKIPNSLLNQPCPSCSVREEAGDVWAVDMEHVCDLLRPFSSHVRALYTIRIQPSLDPQVNNSSHTTLDSPTLVKKCPKTPDFKELLERQKKSSPALE